MKKTVFAVVLLMLAAACSNGGRTKTATGTPASPVDHSLLFSTTPAAFDKLLRSETRRPTVVNLWASWCIPCRTEAPLLRKAAQRYAAQVRFLGLDVQDDRKSGLEFIKQFAIPYPSGFDPNKDVSNHLRVLGLPTTLFYRPGGKLGLTHAGELHGDDLDRAIGEIILASRNPPG